MQPTTLEPTRAPDRPAAPAAPSQPDASAAISAAPRTAEQLRGLRQQRDELTDQLTGTHDRRAQLVGEMAGTSPDVQGVLRQQMVELDRRVLQLEKDVSNIDHAIASASPAVAGGDQPGVLTAVQGMVPPRGFALLSPSGPSPNAVPALLLIVILLQLLAFARARVRRVGPAPQEALVRDAAACLARVEQAVDAIAVEVERVSEGQRFVTRAVAERTGSRVGVE